MKKRAKRYSPEFVTRAVELADRSPQPVADVARDLGVTYATLYGWMRKAGKTRKVQDAAAPAAGPVARQTDAVTRAEIEQLRRELEEVKKERDFLKKAAAFFAQQSK
jgi:transposase